MSLAPAIAPAFRRPPRADGGVWVAQPCDNCGHAVGISDVVRTPDGAAHRWCPLAALDHQDRRREREAR